MDDESYRDHLVDEAMDILEKQESQKERKGSQGSSDQPAKDGFTRWEERFLLQHHDTKTVTEIADKIGRDVDDVRQRMQEFGLLE